jgi:hypothetical protein
VCALLWPVAGGAGIGGVTKVSAAPAAAPGVAQATTTTLTLQVVSARTEPRAFDGAGVVQGDPVTT